MKNFWLKYPVLKLLWASPMGSEESMKLKEALKEIDTLTANTGESLCQKQEWEKQKSGVVQCSILMAQSINNGGTIDVMRKTTHVG